MGLGGDCCATRTEDAPTPLCAQDLAAARVQTHERDPKAASVHPDGRRPLLSSASSCRSCVAHVPPFCRQRAAHLPRAPLMSPQPIRPCGTKSVRVHVWPISARIGRALAQFRPHSGEFGQRSYQKNRTDLAKIGVGRPGVLSKVRTQIWPKPWPASARPWPALGARFQGVTKLVRSGVKTFGANSVRG